MLMPYLFRESGVSEARIGTSFAPLKKPDEAILQTAVSGICAMSAGLVLPDLPCCIREGGSGPLQFHHTDDLIARVSGGDDKLPADVRGFVI